LSIWGQTKPENPKRGSAVFLKAVKQAPKKPADGYRNAAGLQPDSVVTAVKLFTTFNQQNKIGEQKSRVEIIEKLMPGHSVVKLFWGLICYSEKDFSTAKNYWRLIHLYQKNWGGVRELEHLRTRYLGLVCDNLHLETEAAADFTRAKYLIFSIHQNPTPDCFVHGLSAGNFCALAQGIWL